MSEVASKFAVVTNQLKRRRILRVAVAYGVVALVVGLIAVLAVPALNLPGWATRLVFLGLALGMPILVVLAWAFDHNPREAATVHQPVAEAVVQTDPVPPARATGQEKRHLPGKLGAPPVIKVAELATRVVSRGAAPSTPPTRDRIERASLAQVKDQLRTPASAIVSYARMLLADMTGPDRDELRNDVEKIRSSGELFLSRLQDLLDPEHATWRDQSEDRSMLLGRLRHELRTPLNAVIGYSELILESQLEAPQDEAIAEDIRHILAAAREALSAAEGIVDASELGRTSVVGLSRASALAEEVLAKIQPLWADSTGVPLQQGTLLVVDDAEANRELLSHQLARQGYTVHRAASGRAAFEMLETQKVDLILLDILMPEMDGIDVLRRLKADHELRETPVIVTTALDELDSVIRCIQMGAEDFVTKPFDPVLLGARISTILEVHRLREREREYADALSRQQEWSDRLLIRAFPSRLARRVKLGETGIVESTPEASVLVAGLSGPSELSRLGPVVEVERVGDLFSRFDSLVEPLGIEMVKTTGHCYIVVAGMLGDCADHDRVIADLALALHEETRRFSQETREQFRLRIGIHVGPVVAGIIASRHLTFDVWGDAVETAHQLQVTAAPATIHVSRAVHDRLRESHSLITRGVVNVPGKGEMRTYLLQSPTVTVTGHH